MGPIHYLFRKKFIPSPPETRALQNIELPEEEKAGEDLASKRRVRIKYTKPSKRPLYSLQVECLIIISRALHLYKGGTSLTYNFEDTDVKITLIPQLDQGNEEVIRVALLTFVLIR